MCRTSSMVYTPSDEARELYICTINNGDVYPQIQAVIANLKKKYKKGSYNKDLAVDAWYHVAEHEAVIYYKEFGYKFTVTERFTCAVNLEEYYREQVQEQ